jgi:hypothetical protein
MNKKLINKRFFDKCSNVFWDDLSGISDLDIKCFKQLSMYFSQLRANVSKENKANLSKIPRSHPLKCTFGLFETMGLGTKEIAHTKLLAWLLFPKNNHGFDATLLKALLNNFSTKPIYKLKITKEPTTEFKITSKVKAGRIDILAEGTYSKNGVHNKKWIMVLEAKINSSEGHNQLERYLKFVNDNYPEILPEDRYMIYLTVEGKKPSSYDIQNWRTLSYSKLASILQSAKKSNTEDGNQILRFYISGILRDIVGITIGSDSSLTGNPYTLKNALDELGG